MQLIQGLSQTATGTAQLGAVMNPEQQNQPNPSQVQAQQLGQQQQQQGGLGALFQSPPVQQVQHPSPEASQPSWLAQILRLFAGR